jgi:hypothetical protein
LDAVKAVREIVRFACANPVYLDESAVGVMAFQRYIWWRQNIGLADALFARRGDLSRPLLAGFLRVLPADNRGRGRRRLALRDEFL